MNVSEDFLKKFRLISIGIATIMTWLLGDWDISLNILAIFMIIDYITGIMAARFNRIVNSNMGYKGIFKKILIVFVLIIGSLLDRLVNNGAWTFRTLICYFYISNEGISILENIGRCGVELPEALEKVLEQMKDKGDMDYENRN